MCGVIGLRCEKDRTDLGAVSSKLLRMLEYRGYDSTGAAIQNGKGEVILRKDVGAPSVVTETLGINKLQGKLFCGQVRWATFGTVTKENAQPHEVKCKTHIYGAHNGNVTNCDQLKDWLIDQGHNVVSDNDGEMVVHTVEHFFDPSDTKGRKEALKNAVIKAATKIVGSFAAVIVDPATENMVAIKAGSSLYMGQGHHEQHGSFIIASSDLASVLSQTKILLPINEDEFCIFTDKEYEFYNLHTGEKLHKEPVRSKLKIEDIKLNPPFKYFMEQEIHSQAEASRRVISSYVDDPFKLKFIKKIEKEHLDIVRYVRNNVNHLSGSVDWDDLSEDIKKFLSSPEITKLRTIINKGTELGDAFESSMSSFLDELLNAKYLGADRDILRFIDAVFVMDELADARNRVKKFADILTQAHKKGNSIYCVACGTSFNAAKTASVFFNYIAGINVLPLLPGDFRSQCSNAIKDGDVIVGISQSGETKDLIDIFNQVRNEGKKTANITIVNNINSTLALEKSDLYIQLFCGAEVAVPATKSFISQLIVLYILALNIGERLGRDVKKYSENLKIIPDLISRTIETTKDSIEEVAEDLYLEPSIHILATGMQGIAREGALKVREVVLNHTEGYEATEFKHGPNTILGVNTVFGIDSVRALLRKFSDTMNFVLNSDNGKGLNSRNLHKLYRSVADYAFADIPPRDLDPKESKIFDEIFTHCNFFESLYTNYPLIFITGPSERDVNLTISQINTHKIRGANIYAVAEANRNLYDAVTKVKAVKYSDEYKCGYIELPQTGDNLLPFFSSAVVLQLLAFKMSIKKLALLERLDIKDHGVHPDTPKNVSKSITVD